MLEIFSRHFQQVSNHCRIGLRHTIQAFAFDTVSGDVDDGFGRETMDSPFSKSENIARQVKGADLGRRRQELVTPNRPFNYLIDIVGGLCLSENFRAFGILKFA